MKKLFETWKRFTEQTTTKPTTNIDTIINVMFQDEDLDADKRPAGKPFRQRVQKYKKYIQSASDKSGIDPALIMAIMANESSMGAQLNYKGLMQLTKIARKDINEKRNGQYSILHKSGKILPVNNCKVLYPNRKEKTTITSGNCLSDKKYYTSLDQNLEYKGGEPAEVNILAGALYLKFIKTRIKLQSLSECLCGYRHGPYKVKKKKIKTCAYAKKVLIFYNRSKRSKVISPVKPDIDKK